MSTATLTEPATTMSAEEFFRTSAPPRDFAEQMNHVEAFAALHARRQSRVVLVTSGGTTVPLESQTVRFVDNFSAGTRGAISAEKFLEQGYAVIFLHRQFSRQPYSRYYSHSTNCFLDFLSVNPGGHIEVVPQKNEELKKVLLAYKKAKDNQMLLMPTFTTIKEYLFLLQGTSALLAPLKSRAMMYLAAAVSDFFIPESRMVEHKIQSGEGGLVLRLDQVPKILSPLVKQWAPDAFVISFKLETDEKLLRSKAKQSLERYGHQVVIANMLQTRKFSVTIVTPTSEEEITLSKEEVARDVEIESKLIPRLVEMHERFLQERLPGEDIDIDLAESKN